MIRWNCPRCGSGTNAPERPRRDDVRRYCLSCSEKTGRLVERTAPKLERRREVARLRSQEKATRRREKQREARLTKVYDALGVERGVDVEKLARQALRDISEPENRRKVERIARCLEVTVRRRTDGGYSGRAYPFEERIVVSIGRQRGGFEDLLVLVYHEVAHLVAGSSPDDRRNWHGEKFQRVFADALQRRWPFVTYGALRRQSGYEAGWEVRAQLRDHVRAGGDL